LPQPCSRSKAGRSRGCIFCCLRLPSKRTERQNSVRRIEERLKIPVSYVHLEEVFTQKVIEPFVDAYLDGLTPNPCVVCNQEIKFDHLLRRADEEEISFVATGHYALIRRPENSPADCGEARTKARSSPTFSIASNNAIS